MIKQKVNNANTQLSLENEQIWKGFCEEHPYLKGKKIPKAIMKMFIIAYEKRNKLDERLMKPFCTKEFGYNDKKELFNVLLLPDTVYNEATNEHFNLGLQLGQEIENLHMLQIDKTLGYLVKKGVITKQVLNRIYYATYKVLGEYSNLGKIPIAKNLNEMVRHKLSDWKIPLDKVDKKIRDRLAKEFNTSYASITDALSKMKI